MERRKRIDYVDAMGAGKDENRRDHAGERWRKESVSS